MLPQNGPFKRCLGSHEETFCQGLKEIRQKKVRDPMLTVLTSGGQMSRVTTFSSRLTSFAMQDIKYLMYE